MAYELDEDMRLFDKKAREEFNALPMEKKAKSLAAKTFILYPFEVHYKVAQAFDIKEDESLFLIEQHLKKFKKCFVSTSYGMDSIVLMHLVIRAAKKAGVEVPEMWLNNTLNIYKEEPAYWKKMNKLFDIEDKFRMFKPPKDEKGNRHTVWSIAKKYNHLPHFRSYHGKKSSKIKTKAESNDANAGAIPECCDLLKKKSIKIFLKQLPTDERYECHFVGTRAEESRIRKIGVMQRCRSYVIKYLWPYHIRAVTPLSFWTKEDIQEYYRRYNIPKNPTYEIHNMERMGCASCPAHKMWEIRLAKDPTNEGMGMLKQNLLILQRTQPERYQKSIALLKKNNMAALLINELEGTNTMDNYLNQSSGLKK